jgi:hypothetical protein
MLMMPPRIAIQAPSGHKDDVKSSNPSRGMDFVRADRFENAAVLRGTSLPNRNA